MSEETEHPIPEEQPIPEKQPIPEVHPKIPEEQPTPVEQPEIPKPLPKPVPPKKQPFQPFGGKNNHFNSSKSGNPSNRGKSFKGGGVKKGK